MLLGRNDFFFLLYCPPVLLIYSLSDFFPLFEMREQLFIDLSTVFSQSILLAVTLRISEKPLQMCAWTDCDLVMHFHEDALPLEAHSFCMPLKHQYDT